MNNKNLLINITFRKIKAKQANKETKASNKYKSYADFFKQLSEITNEFYEAIKQKLFQKLFSYAKNTDFFYLPCRKKMFIFPEIITNRKLQIFKQKQNISFRNFKSKQRIFFLLLFMHSLKKLISTNAKVKKYSF